MAKRLDKNGTREALQGYRVMSGRGVLPGGLV